MTTPNDDHSDVCRDPHMPNIGTHGRASGYSWVYPHCNQCGLTLSKERIDGMVACPRCAALLATDNATHPCLKGKTVAEARAGAGPGPPPLSMKD